MNKKIGSITTSIALILILTGCDTTNRIKEQSENQAKNNPNSGNIIPPSDQNETIPMTPPSQGTIENDKNSTVGEIKIDAKNAYRVKLNFSDNYNEKGYFSRSEVGEIHFDITNLYTNEPADINKIEQIVLEAQNRENNLSGKYFNFITYDGKEGAKYIIPKNKIKASDNVALKIKDLSGTTNILFKAKIKLDDNETSTYELKIPMVIEKNKSSSMAIVPYQATYENGLFTEKFVIQAVDSYGNKAQDGTRISTGVINNPKLYFEGFGDNISNTGKLDKNNNEFELPQNSLNTNIIKPTDTLITIATPEEHKPENLGGWDIIDLLPQESKVKIINIDKGTTVSNIGYVIGDEYRYDECHQTIMNAAAATFESTEVKDGIAYATLRYVPAMVGKTIFIYANARLDDKRIGISRRVPLTGTGLKKVTISCTNDKGQHPSCDKLVTFFQNGSNDYARKAFIGLPINTGDADNAIVSFPDGYQTDCNGNLHVQVNNIDVNKTATYVLGVIATEDIKNKQ